jgi:hypothetical protein
MNRKEGNRDIVGGELLQRVGKGYAFLRDQLHEEVGRHDLGYRAKTNERVSAGLLVRAGIRLTVALHPRLIAADNHDNHSDGAAAVEKVIQEGIGGLELGERRGLGVHPVPCERQEEDEGGKHSPDGMRNPVGPWKSASGWG